MVVAAAARTLTVDSAQRVLETDGGFGDKLTSFLGVALGVVIVVGTVVLVAWRLWARRNHDDLASGVATAALVVTAVVVPVGLALLWDGATSLAFWWSAGVALTAAALASTEWLRVLLRAFAVLATFALAALLLRIGADHVDDERCNEVGRLATDVTSLKTTQAHAVSKAGDTAHAARDKLASLARSGTSDPALAVGAQKLVTALDARDDDQVAQAVATLDAAYRPTVGSRADAELLTAADTAVSTAQAATALQGVEAPDSVAELEAAACGDMQRLVTDVELTDARSATAAYRSSLQPTDANKAAAQKAADAADEAAARVSRGEGDEGTAWPSLVKQGGTVAGSAALAGLPGSPEPDIWFWVALAVLVLAGWWLVERRSASTVAGPVNVTFQGVDLEDADKGKQPGKEAQQAVFVTALMKNLREPGPTPGSQASSPLTDLEGVIKAADPTKVFAAIFEALKKLLNGPRGSTVNAQVLAPLPGDKRWRVFVVVADAATGRAVASKEITDESGAEACRVAGYWASATVLSTSPRMPLWARWSPATAQTFAAYDTASDPSKDALEAALREAPASSLVLHKLADQLSLEAEYADAAQLYARAVVVDPTDHTSVYRLAATLATLARNEDWNELTFSRRAAAIALFNRAAGRAQVSATIMATETPQSLRTQLEQLSRALFERLHSTLDPGHVMVRYFRRDQREAIGSLPGVFTKYSRAARSRAAVRAAGLSVGAFASQSGALEETEAFASDPRSGWQVCYNLACRYALRDDGADAAIGWLETALTRPGVEALGAWLAEDPDLEKVRGLPRFVLLQELLSSRPEEL